MLRRLIVGISGSKISRSAVQAAIHYAQRHQAEVVGVSAIDVARITSGEPVPLGGAAFKLQRDEALMAQAHQESERWLAEFRSECETGGVRHQTVQATGEPAEILAREAQRGDLLILGRKSIPAEGQERSNTIEHVLRLSGRPILTVPADGFPDGRPALVAYDGSPQAAAAIQAFQLLGLAANRPVHILLAGPSDSESSSAALAADYLQLHGHEVVKHHEKSHKPAWEVIVQEANRLKAGVIVMGSCGRPRIAEALFGSTTRKVLAHSETALFLHH